MRVARPRVEERPAQVDRHHVIEVGDGRVDEPGLHADARVVDQDVEPAEMFDREPDRRVDVILIRGVGVDEPCLTGVGYLQPLERLRPSASSRPVTTTEAPSARNRSAIAEPDPRGSSGHERSLAVETRRIRRSLPSVDGERRSRSRPGGPVH